MMVSGYCKCGFPASERCPECGAKLCGNCLPKHKCPEVYEERVAADAPAPVLDSVKRKPGRPPVKK